MSLVRSVTRIKVPGLPQIVPVLAILMEVFWSYAWLVWVSGWATLGWERPPLTIISCMLLAVVTEVLARLSLAKKWSLRSVRLVVLPSSIILLVALVRWNQGGGYSLWDAGWLGYAETHISSIVVALIFGIYLIWRGISAGRKSHSFDDLHRKFVIGMVGIIVLLVIWGIAGGGNTIWSSVGVYIISYFGVGLLAVAIANLETLRSELLKHKEDISAFSRRWISMLVALVGSILGISVALASIFSPNIWETILHGFSVLGDWLLIALSYILLPVGYLLAALIYIGRFLINWLRGDQPLPQFNMPDLSDLQKAAQGQSPVQIPEGLILALKWGGLALLVSLVIFFLARALARYWRGKNEEDVEEVHETFWSFSLFKTDLHTFLSWLFRWARRRKKASPEAALLPIAAMNGENDSRKIFDVRELYRALLWQGRQLGTPRQTAETPYEYRNKLEPLIEAAKDEIDALTEAYIVERYGEAKPELKKLELLNRLWRSLKSKLTNAGSDK